MNNNKKKSLAAKIIIPLLILLLLIGSFFGAKKLRISNTTAEVYSVEYLNWGYMEDAMSIDGMVFDQDSQSIYPDATQIISEVYVTQGQTVKAGDPLLAYDTASQDLTLQIRKVAVEKTKNALNTAKAELAELNGTTPVPDHSPSYDPNYNDDPNTDHTDSQGQNEQGEQSEPSSADNTKPVEPAGPKRKQTKDAWNFLDADSIKDYYLLIPQSTSENTVTVSYVDTFSGEIETLQKDTVEDGATEPSPPEVPTHEGYYFNGWERTVDDSGNITYTAIWTEESSGESSDDESGNEDTPSDGSDNTETADDSTDDFTDDSTEDATDTSSDAADDTADETTDETTDDSGNGDATDDTSDATGDESTEEESEGPSPDEEQEGGPEDIPVVRTTSADAPKEGTAENPYRYLVTEDGYIYGSFLNEFAKKDNAYAVIEIREGNVKTGALLGAMVLNSNKIKPQNPKQYWFVMPRADNELPKDPDETNNNSDSTTPPVSDDDVTDDFYDNTPASYTASELAEAIKQKQREIRDLDLDVRRAELDLKILEQQLADGVVKAKRDGVISILGDKNHPPQDGSPFLKVDAGSGAVVQGSISELQLKDIAVGQIITATDWETGGTYEGEIISIDDYPSDNKYYYGGNPNASYYGFLAYFNDAENLEEGHYLQMSLDANANKTTSIYLPVPYIRRDGNGKYVMKDDNGVLKKQYVKCGKSYSGMVTEILEGLSNDDRISFPYGPGAEEGAKTTEPSGEGEETIY